MVVHKLRYTALIEIDFSAVENWQHMYRYMMRHGWRSVGLGDQKKLMQDEHNSMDCYGFTKNFTNVNVMQNEIEDIEDAFNR